MNTPPRRSPSTGLPVELLRHLHVERDRIQAALSALDQSAWRFSFHAPAVFAVRIWPHVAVDTLVVLGPDFVRARRDVLLVGDVWSVEGTVEDVVAALAALDPPRRPGDGSTP